MRLCFDLVFGRSEQRIGRQIRSPEPGHRRIQEGQIDRRYVFQEGQIDR